MAHQAQLNQTRDDQLLKGGTQNPPIYDNSTSGVQETEEPRYNWPVLCLFIIVFLAIGGNILVCLAVKYERKLQNMFNYFLVSLALSDMLSATLVMPLSIIKALIDHLPVPKLMCVAWYSLDVLFTSSTIIHLCMINVDRYMTLKYPLKYGHSKNSRQTAFKIILVWIMSFCIAGPLFLLSMFDKQSNVHYKGCGPETPVFVISATVTSFYLPLLIMTIMYAMTVRVLRQQLKEQRRLTVTNSLSARDESSHSLRKPSPKFSPRLSNGSSRETTYISTSGAGKSPLLKHKELLAGEQDSADTSPASASERTTDGGGGGNHLQAPRITEELLTPSSTCTDIALQELDTDGNNIHMTTRTNSARRKFHVRTFRFRRNESTSGSTRRAANGLDKGRRAVQVLGILFAVFVFFYLPFFAAYIINGTCQPCQPYISPRMIMAFEWLAYSGSMVNPIIYHIFNPDFRRAFQKILRCKCSKL